MERNLELKQVAQDTIKKYIEKGYIKEVQSESEVVGWWLPIFAIIGKKIRLVWDAAAEFEGCSLNSKLTQGPDLNEPLWDVLYRFREWPVAICADIAEMFHQIRIKEEDKRFQRFLWRSDPTQAIKTYEMQVMTFGANCTPCTAQFVKNMNAAIFKEGYPEAVYAITKCHYVDDWLMSCRTEEDAIRLAHQVIDIQAHAGFSFYKWSSISNQLLKEVGVRGDISKELVVMTKALGIDWNTCYDELSFSIDSIVSNKYKERNPIKKEMLSQVMKMWGPLGLISHFVILGRMILQEVWRAWWETLEILRTLKVPRWVGISTTTREIHIFVDASERAMAAVAYVRGIGPSGMTTVPKRIIE